MSSIKCHNTGKVFVSLCVSPPLNQNQFSFLNRIKIPKKKFQVSFAIFSIAILFSLPGIYIPFVAQASTNMALDSTSPQSVTGTGNLTTASFIPPANSVIVVTAMSDEGSTQTFTVTDNLRRT